MQTPERQLYKKYGDPYRVVEFRIFSFNSCGAGCKNCFYKKNDNNYNDFKSVLNFARELSSKEYTLETCYLLPTDVFENEFNFKIFEDPTFKEVLELFNFVGLATTLRNGFNRSFLDHILSFNESTLKIELHVNIREDLIDDPVYIRNLEKDLKELKFLYGSKILINLAINLGTKLSHSDHEELKRLIFHYSDDKILEMNFTFMFNPTFPKEEKIRLLVDSYPTIQYFTEEYRQTESDYTRRTLLRKPSIVFKDNKMYLSPILPFDEYVFLDDNFCRIQEPTWDSFLETYLAIESKNLPILPECSDCHNLEYCQGKAFFALAQTLTLPCIKKEITNVSPV